MTYWLVMRQLASRGTPPSPAALLLVRCEIWHGSTLAWRKPNYKVGGMDFGLSSSSSGDLVLKTISALINGGLNKACILGGDVGWLAVCHHKGATAHCHENLRGRASPDKPHWIRQMSLWSFKVVICYRLRIVLELRCEGKFSREKIPSRRFLFNLRLLKM